MKAEIKEAVRKFEAIRAGHRRRRAWLGRRVKRLDGMLKGAEGRVRATILMERARCQKERETLRHKEEWCERQIEALTKAVYNDKDGLHVMPFRKALRGISL